MFSTLSAHASGEEKNEQKEEAWHTRGKKEEHLKSVLFHLSENGIKNVCYVSRISNLNMQKFLAC